MFVPITIDGKEYRLRYPTKIHIDVERSGYEFLFGQKGKITLLGLLQEIDSALIQSYLLWKGLAWENPDLKFEDVCDLRDRYIETGELDTGERLNSLVEKIVEAVLQSYGMDPNRMKKKEKSGTGK